MRRTSAQGGGLRTGLAVLAGFVIVSGGGGAAAQVSLSTLSQSADGPVCWSWSTPTPLADRLQSSIRYWEFDIPQASRTDLCGVGLSLRRYPGGGGFPPLVASYSQSGVVYLNTTAWVAPDRFVVLFAPTGGPLLALPLNVAQRLTIGPATLQYRFDHALPAGDRPATGSRHFDLVLVDLDHCAVERSDWTYRPDRCASDPPPPTPPPTPGSVTGVRVLPRDGALHVSWNAAGGEVSQYRVDAVDAAGALVRRVYTDADVFEAVVDGLVNGVEYTVTVTALTGHPDVEGPASEPETETPRSNGGDPIPTPTLPLAGAGALAALLVAGAARRLRGGAAVLLPGTPAVGRSEDPRS